MDTDVVLTIFVLLQFINLLTSSEMWPKRYKITLIVGRCYILYKTGYLLVNYEEIFNINVKIQRL